ncbi:MAG: tetratricopeptide repeat protein [Caldilineaceae bacterium]|nr:tetratricopeptide repeat protein [Caldilineaceae bacterium]
MDTPSTYIPLDRRHALAQGVDLPERSEGAVLFADISGFTPLTAALTRALGPRRGAEELTLHLNRVFDALILALHRYGGSVIGFSGDAVTCWLDGDDGRRGVTCALAMQRIMEDFATVRIPSGQPVDLAIKVAVVVGPVRRILVGDPDFTVMDTLVGATMERMAAAEGVAERGDVVVDEAVAATLDPVLEIGEWRVDDATGDRFAVVRALGLDVPEAPWPPLSADALTTAQKQAWIQPPIYQRMLTGRGEFLAELRPVVPLFVRFRGIAYDADPAAPQKLDQFLRRVQQILARYDASLMHITTGDKGSYLQAAFGAPIAHEDDEVRAAAAALAIQAVAAQLPFLDEVQIGIARGRMRTGSYGGTTRRTYGMMGDDVILGARLMAAAGTGQILVSRDVQRALTDKFALQQLAPIRVKGREEPIALARLVGAKDQVRIKPLEPQYALPMVGRADEQARIAAMIELAAAGKGQVVGITAEAGMGKSRLAAQVIQQAQAVGFAAYGGECQSYGVNSAYLVWQNIWRGFFGLDRSRTPAEQIDAVAGQLARIDPALVPRLPLLGSVLNLALPDTPLTGSFDPKLRKSSLEAMLVDCLQARAKLTPLLLVLEDCHWLDPLSHDLIDVMARALANLPVIMLLVYRPPDQLRLQAPRVSALPHFTEIELADFTADEAARLIALKLQQFLGDERAIPDDFVQTITARAAGNPFYIEEILNYLQDVGVDPTDRAALATVDLPTSIYSLILSRIDQLNDQQQITLRVASVIGRLFRAAMVWGVYPELGNPDRVRTDLELLSNLELTPLDTPDPELAYLFKHVMTQEVAYESLPFATRANLHGQIGDYIERTYGEHLDQYLDLLAFHYDQSTNVAQKRRYLRQAADAARADYANTAAIDYYSRLLPHLDDDTRGDVLYQLGQIWTLLGDYDNADDAFRQALTLATRAGAAGQADGDIRLEIQCRIALGELQRNRSEYDAAARWFEDARALADAAGDQDGIAKALVCSGSLALYLGDFAAAEAAYAASLTIRRALDDQPNMANVINNLAIAAANQGDFATASARFEESLALRRTLGDKWGIANSLSNLGQLAQLQAAYPQARTHLDEAIALCREIGDKWLLGNALLNQANVLRGLDELTPARELYLESLAINRDLGDQWMLAYLLEDIGGLLARQGEETRPLQLAGAASTVRATLGTPLTAQEQATLDEALAVARTRLGAAAADAAGESGRALPLAAALDLALQ